MVLVHLPVVPSEEMEQWFHRQKTDSADGVQEGIVRGTRGDTEYSPNILRNSPKGRIHAIRGIEPLVQDVLQEQPVSSLIIQSRGAVRNKTPLLGQAFHRLSSPYSPRTAHCCLLPAAHVLRIFSAACAQVCMLPE